MRPRGAVETKPSLTVYKRTMKMKDLDASHKERQRRLIRYTSVFFNGLKEVRLTNYILVTNKYMQRRLIG